MKLSEYDQSMLATILHELEDKPGQLGDWVRDMQERLNQHVGEEQ